MNWAQVTPSIKAEPFGRISGEMYWGVERHAKQCRSIGKKVHILPVYIQN